MKTKAKPRFKMASFLILFGVILFAGVMTALRWDFMKLSTVKHETNAYEITEAFDSISINTDTADITFLLSDDGKCLVECFEEENAKHSVYAKDGALTVERNDKRTVYDFIGFNFETPGITVYLPQTEYDSLFIHASTGDIDIPRDFFFNKADISVSTGDIDFCASASEQIKMKTSTGDISAENITAGALEISVTTGRVTVSGVKCEGDVTIGVTTGKAFLTDVACNSVISRGSTGNITLKNVVANDSFSIKRSTGDIRLNGSDAARISIKTSTGDVSGTLLSGKEFIADTSTGSINVPDTISGGRCEITTSTGDIEIEIVS